MSVESVHREATAAASQTSWEAGGAGNAEEAKITFRHRLRRWYYHRAVRGLTLLHMAALAIAGWIGRRPHRPGPEEGYEIMVTGRFDSDNWILAHLGPLSASKACSRLWMVSTNPVPRIPKVTGIYPPRWLVKFVGTTAARLLTFAYAALWIRPHIVGGFHLLINGMVTAVVARLVGAKAMYFCVGGPAEVIDGGIWGEPGPFAKMGTPDPVVERRLLKAVASCDVVITMGTAAREFFREKCNGPDVFVVSGGIDSREFRPTASPPSTDLILVGRLVEIKRIETFLHGVKLVQEKIPGLTAAIVGNGPSRGSLEQVAQDLGISHCVRFVGHQRNVSTWLAQAKIFVLTSRSEGLSLSLMEAMMCGLPAVVSNVGDLANLVENGVNGYLVEYRSPEAFAGQIVELLMDQDKYAAFSRAARSSALRYGAAAATRKWDSILVNHGSGNPMNCRRK